MRRTWHTGRRIAKTSPVSFQEIHVDNDPAVPRVTSIVINPTDEEKLAGFWAELLGLGDGNEFCIGTGHE
jgi:hypothetical protein